MAGQDNPFRDMRYVLEWAKADFIRNLKVQGIIWLMVLFLALGLGIKMTYSILIGGGVVIGIIICHDLIRRWLRKRP